MPSYLCFSIRFLQSAFHGRRGGTAPEWPPSPLRVFQSLLATAARLRLAAALTALEWLEQQPSPIIIATPAVQSFGYRLSVPNNAMDVVARAWCRGNESNSGDANPATHRTMKNVRPMLMVDGDAVHYLWLVAEPISMQVRSHIEMLCTTARSIVALGWGIDMAIGHAQTLSNEQVKALPGEFWFPSVGSTDDGLRVPKRGTLKALVDRHRQFLGRLGEDGFTAQSPLTEYQIIKYRRAFDPPSRPFAVFSLLKPDGSAFRPFDTARQALTVAGMARFTTKVAAESAGWSNEQVNKLILGHGEANGAEHAPVGAGRFGYLPLPTIEMRTSGSSQVGSVRRMMVSCFSENNEEKIAWARRSLSGQELVDKDNKEPVALLSLVPATDNIVRRYTQPAVTWVTVTPVVLPGYDDPAHYRRRLKCGVAAEEQGELLGRLHNRIDGLLRKAIIQAGFSQVLADRAEIEWRKVGFLPGTDLADRYGVPDHLKRFPRYHVKIIWRDAQNRQLQLPGPICLGGGRFYGLGLFVAG